MNKILLLILFIAVVSCKEKNIDCSGTYILNNNTEKLIVLVVRQLYPSDSLMLVPYETDTTGTLSVQASYFNCHQVLERHEFLYNINDTSYLTILWNDWVEDRYNIDGYNTIADSLRSAACKSDDSKDVTVRTITVTDTLLTIFEKDYTMLEKFKEYYQK